MKRTLKIIALLLICGTIFFLLNDSLAYKATAYETTCPSWMSDQECLTFLQEQTQLIADEKNNLNTSINAENFEQMSLSQQIAYLASSVKETELEIAEKELDIEKKNVEIRLLGNDILDLQNSIDTLTQEINNLKDIMSNRTQASYKMTFVSPIEIILDSKNFETMMRRMKYLMEAKKKDRELLSDMAVSRGQLEDEEVILNEKRAEIQTKRNDIEAQRADLAEDRKNLESQQAQQQVLLAESQKREQEYNDNLAELQAMEDSITAQVTQLIMQLYQSGQLPADTPVSKGDVIGFQGHTGFAYGSHLHFELNFGNTNPFSNGYLTGGGAIYASVNSGSAHTPLSGAHLTQGFHSGGYGGGYAIDLVSFTHGIQPQDYYCVEAGQVCCFGTCVPAGCWYGLKGEGAPIHAIKDGMITKVTMGVCGGKYTVVDHGGGETSLYLHLR